MREQTQTMSPEQILTLLQAQRAMADELSQLTHQHASAIADGRADRLLDLLAQRQLVLDRFLASQAAMSEVTASIDRSLQNVSADVRSRIEALVSEISEFLSDLMKRDERDQAALRQQQRQVRSDLESLGVANKARHAYQASSGQNRFEDRRG